MSQARMKEVKALDRRLLVLYKVYPKLSQVPDALPANELMRLRGKFAIHVNVAAMIVGFFGYVGASKFGKHYHLESSDEPLMRPDSVWKK